MSTNTDLIVTRYWTLRDALSVTPDLPFESVLQKIKDANERHAQLRSLNAELLAALQNIAEEDTTYPPNYNIMTPADQERYILYGRSALLARDAIAKAAA